MDDEVRVAMFQYNHEGRAMVRCKAHLERRRDGNELRVEARFATAVESRASDGG